MPNCFTLTPKGETEPARLAAIDDAMCAHFGVAPDPDKYYQFWVDCEGLALACGKDWTWMRENFPERVGIIDWLAEHYTPDAWCER